MPHTGMSLDSCVHQRLCVTRFIAFVVPEPSEADQVENDIFVELPAIVERDLHNAIRRLGGIAVYVEDRCLCYLCGVCRINRAAAELGRCCKSDLVIDDDVDGSAGPISGQA